MSIKSCCDVFHACLNFDTKTISTISHCRGNYQEGLPSHIDYYYDSLSGMDYSVSKLHQPLHLLSVSMRYKNAWVQRILLGFLVGTLLIVVPLSASCSETLLSGKVTKVIDGDSFILRTPKVSYEIRLWGVDCPEYTQPFASEARAISRKYLKGKKIKVQVKYRDRYGRFIGLATKGNLNINQKLVEDGAAWVYTKYCQESICNSWASLEKKARNSRKGLWRNADARPPWIWRREKR